MCNYLNSRDSILMMLHSGWTLMESCPLSPSCFRSFLHYLPSIIRAVSTPARHSGSSLNLKKVSSLHGRRDVGLRIYDAVSFDSESCIVSLARIAEHCPPKRVCGQSSVFASSTGELQRR